MKTKLKIVNSNRKEMLQKVTSDVQKAGLTAPAADSDKRSQDVWSVIENHDGIYSITFEEKFDYRELASPNSKYISYFQVRDNSSLEKRIAVNHIKFFGQDPERLRRSPIVFKIRDEDGSIYTYPAVGHGRGYCFKDEESRQPAIVVDCTSMPLLDALKFGFKAASKSNGNNDDAVEPEKKADLIQQCRTLSKLEGNKISPEEMRLRLDRFLCSKYGLDKPELQGHRTDIVNMALGNGRSNAMPMPESQEISEKWGEFFNGQNFNTENESTVIHIINNGLIADIERSILFRWRAQPESEISEVRKPCHLALRIGSSKSVKGSLTVIKDVVKGREAMIKGLELANRNGHYKKGGVPIVLRVMFVKQLEKGADFEAYEWDMESEVFVKVGTPSQKSLDF
jgi:hypothetical protein